MASDSNRLSRFWRELKRRKVIRAITVYAAAAFVFLELTDIVAPSLGLPDWTLNFILILLLAGFIIALILSWIYDIHPEGGIVKTEPAHKTETKDVAKSSSSWRLASFISFVVILVLLVLNIIPRSKRSEKSKILDKSIAVLPFINDSPEEERMYFINGTMEAILDNLCKIQDLRVVSRTSVEQYRDNPKPIQEIGREMNVAYVLEGSGLKHGDNIRLTLQLIEAATDRHIWSDSYNKSEEEVFDLYGEIAKLVAAEIEALISPEEKERIERIPSTSQTALDLYQKAKEEDPDKALELLYYALEYDSTFAAPYVHIGWIYWNKYYYNPDLFGYLKDSAMILAEKALHFDPQSAGAYNLKAYIFNQEGKVEEALSSFDQAIHLNPNLGDAYIGKGWLYFEGMDYVNTLENFQQSILRDRTPHNLSNLYDKMGFILAYTGFVELANHYYEKALKWHGDTAWHILRQAQTEQYTGNYARALELALKGYALAPDKTYALIILGENYLLSHQYEESFKYLNECIDIMEERGLYIPWHNMIIAFSLMNSGHEDRAELLIAAQIKQSEEEINNRTYGNAIRYSYLAMAYALKGDNENAIQNLSLLSQHKGMNATVNNFPEHPIFENLKDDPEFIQICELIHSKYQLEHNRVRQWLEENDIL